VHFAVILACRDVARGQQLAAKVAAEQLAAGVPEAVDVVQLDLTSLESVEACAAQVRGMGQPLHILINNAGIFDMSGAPFHCLLLVEALG
jgi:retinol dehydrogenase 12